MIKLPEARIDKNFSNSQLVLNYPEALDFSDHADMLTLRKPQNDDRWCMPRRKILRRMDLINFRVLALLLHDKDHSFSTILPTIPREILKAI